MKQLNDKPKEASSTQLSQTYSKSNMGEMTSKDIGTLPYSGRLGGEMLRRMIKAQEEKMIEKYTNDQMKS